MDGARDHGRGFRVRVSAPGKVILFGEHSVVYQKTAIAATLNLRTELTLVETDSGFVRLKLPSIELDTSFPVSAFTTLETRKSNRPWDDYQKSLSADLDQLCGDHASPELAANKRLALLVFLHCYLSLDCTCHGLDITVTSELVIGAGQGSSASYSLVLSTALFLYGKARTPDQETYLQRVGGKWSLTPALKEVILDRAMSCEKLIHGTPSGLDHTVELLGGAVRFVRDAPPTPLDWQRSTLRVFMVDTRVPRSTKDLVQRVRGLLGRRPEVTNTVLQAMDHVAVTAADLLQASAADFEGQFAELVRLNQGLLTVLGVSHPALDHIVGVATTRGFSAKLTGAGGGGFAYVYLPQSTSPMDITSLNQELIAAGYSVTDVTLGGIGLQVHEFET